MTDEREVEVVAEAAYNRRHKIICLTWKRDAADHERVECMADARAAIAALDHHRAKEKATGVAISIINDIKTETGEAWTRIYAIIGAYLDAKAARHEEGK